MRHILLTVGTNPLPVLVASRRLWAKYGGPESTLALLHSPETKEIANILLKQAVEALGLGGIPRKWSMISVGNATSPADVGRTVATEFVDKVCRPEDEVHLHYTGGTKAMGFHTLRALLAASDKNLRVTDSYLDPRENQLVDGDGNLIDPQVEDERTSWNRNLEQLSRLHGMKTQFNDRLGNRRTGYSHVEFGPANVARRDVRLPNPAPAPSEGVVALCKVMAETLTKGKNFGAFLNNGPEFWKCQFDKDSLERWWDLPRLVRNPEPIVWPGLGNAANNWLSVPEFWNTEWGSNHWQETGQGWQLDLTKLAPGQLEKFKRVTMDNEWLEILTWASFREALQNLGLGENVPLHHSVRFQREGGKGHFEIDVLAIYGYQLLAVSCSVVRDHDKVKQKAFEVLHRARQVGGDGAHVLIVTLQDSHSTQNVEADLRVDLGNEFPGQLMVLSANPSNSLTDRIREHITELGWS